MAASKNMKETLREKKREFTSKRGRIGRSRFFVNLCIVYAFIGAYILALFAIVNCMDSAEVPRSVYNNVYYFGVGLLFLLVAFGTRPLRLKRLRDMGLPVWCDLPFMLLLLLNGLGPVFHFFSVPYMSNLEVISMPDNLRDLLGVFWLIWMLVLILGPSKHRENIFTCEMTFGEQGQGESRHGQ